MHSSFTSVAASAQYVYALYSGKTIKEAVTDKGLATLGHTVLQFDWEGRLLGAIHSNSLLCQIAFDKARERLLLLSETDDGYRISSVLEEELAAN